jgi:hypothetical protein
MSHVLIAAVLISLSVISNTKGSVSYIFDYLQSTSTVSVTTFRSIDPSDPANIDDVNNYSFPLNYGLFKIDISNDISALAIGLQTPNPSLFNNPEDRALFSQLAPILYYKTFTQNNILTDFTVGTVAIDQTTLQSSKTIWIEYYFNVYVWDSGRFDLNNNNNNYKIELNSVPEPSALSLIAVSLGALALMRRRRS